MTSGQPPSATEQAPAIRDRVPGSGARSVAATAVWPLALILACTQCLTARSGGDWLLGALVVGWFVVLDRAFSIPARAWMPAAVRWLLALSVAVLLGALVPLRARSGAWLSWDAAVEALVLVVLAGLGMWSRWVCRNIPDTPALQFPLREGTWRVVEGEGRLLNHHWRAPDQRAALDLVRLGGNGMSHRGLRAGRAPDFFAYGTPVYSPCDGVVVACRDAYDDTPTGGSHPAGNHVVIEAGGITIVLAHFAKGSVLVQQGQQLQAGAELARVGNSGNSAEPHLHVHAQRGGAPLRLRFAGRTRRFPRGATVRT